MEQYTGNFAILICEIYIGLMKNYMPFMLCKHLDALSVTYGCFVSSFNTEKNERKKNGKWSDSVLCFAVYSLGIRWFNEPVY